MATEIVELDLSFKAENTFAAKQFYAVEMSADDQVDVCDATTDTVIGVIQNNPAAGQAASVRVYGVTKWVSDGTPTTVGDYVGTGATGLAVKKSANTDKIAGIALSVAAATGDVISVLLTPGATLSKT
ncbi:MAG: DUF2190 family protein [Methylococcaceae bacterium]|nr:DUF2190 family protein [Methylococcaceae bacterium]